MRRCAKEGVVARNLGRDLIYQVHPSTLSALLTRTYSATGMLHQTARCKPEARYYGKRHRKEITTSPEDPLTGSTVVDLACDRFSCTAVGPAPASFWALVMNV